MLTLIPFKLVFRAEPVWVNPAEVRAVQRRPGGTNSQACIRFAGLPDSAELVVEGSAEEAVQKLTGASAPARPAARPERNEPLNSAAVKALIGEEPG